MLNCFTNRELSWLEFNHRVLMNASNPLVPLCERLNFFSIFQSNLDEFFMVRIGSLHDQKLLDDGSRENKTGMRPSSQIEAALAKIRTICRERDEVYNVLMDDLASQGIRTVRFSDISNEAEEQLGKLFRYYGYQARSVIDQIRSDGFILCIAVRTTFNLQANACVDDMLVQPIMELLPKLT